MNMRSGAVRVLLNTALFACALGTLPGTALAAQSAVHAPIVSPDNAQNGKRLFLAVGCYECHGTTGGGAATGPKLAPNPVPITAFIYQLRHPLGSPPYGNMKMPAYSEAVLSDSQVRDLYAYLQSIKPGAPAPQIPLLSR
jgi:mono/diheme cytochrome c family protein